MENAKHTPGPWRAEGWKNVTVNLPNGDTVATAPGPKNAPLDVLQANAALIAAAPDLLEALESCLRQIIAARLIRDVKTGETSEPSEGETMARAALAKARGEVAR